MNDTAAQLVKAELSTVLHHIDYFTSDAAKLEADLAGVQERLHALKARAVALEDALTMEAA